MHLKDITAFFACGRSRIGIDDSTSPVLYAVASPDGGLASYVCDDAPPWVKNRVASGTGCSMGLPSESGIIIGLNPPELPSSKLRKVLPGLLDLSLPFSLEQCKYAFPDTPGEGVFAIAARNEDIADAISVFLSKKCNPERIVPLPWALWRHSFDEFPCASILQKRAVLIAAGDGNTLVITGTGTHFGGSVVATSAGRDVESILKMSFGGIPENLICICAGLKASECAKELSAKLSGSKRSVCTSNSPVAYAAESLAADYMSDKDNSAQLRTGLYAHVHAASAMKRMLFAASSVLIAAAVLMFFAGISIRICTASYSKRISGQLKTRLSSVAGYDVRTRGNPAVAEAEEALEKRMDPFAGEMTSTKVSASLSKALSAATKSNVKLSHIAVNDGGLSASGSAQTPDAAVKFTELLRNSDIRVTADVSADRAKNGETLFMITPEAGK